MANWGSLHVERRKSGHQAEPNSKEQFSEGYGSSGGVTSQSPRERAPRLDRLFYATKDKKTASSRVVSCCGSYGRDHNPTTRD